MALNVSWWFCHQGQSIMMPDCSLMAGWWIYRCSSKSAHESAGGSDSAGAFTREVKVWAAVNLE
jgi:hypothetical protein